MLRSSSLQFKLADSLIDGSPATNSQLGTSHQKQKRIGTSSSNNFRTPKKEEDELEK